MVVSEDHYFYSHRLDLARAIVRAGYEVHVITRVADRSRADVVATEGITLVHVDVARASLFAPLADVRYLGALTSAYRAIRPDIVHHVAMKPVLYGSIAALSTDAAVVNALAGLGFLFTHDTVRVRAVRTAVLSAFAALFRRNRAVLIVQNEDDLALFRDTLRLPAKNVALVRGAGVDVSVFAPSTRPSRERVVFVMVSRMLRDKGVFELIEAARILRARGVACEVRLVGGIDAANPNSLTNTELESAVAEGVVSWLGHRGDIPAVLADADVAVLPSYREGLPKSLLEAAACGLPVIATDVPGCREVVRHGETGLLVPARDAVALADAMASLAQDFEMRARLGDAGRRLVESGLSSARVADDTLRIYAGLLATKGG